MLKQLATVSCTVYLGYTDCSTGHPPADPPVSRWVGAASGQDGPGACLNLPSASLDLFP